MTISRRVGLVGWIGLIFLASAGAWWLGHSWVLKREMSLAMESADAPRQWAVLWQGRRGEPENGAWIDARTLTAPETLELVVPGKRPDGSPFRLWLDSARGTAPSSRPVDLKAMLGDSSTTGRWQEFGNEGGLAFVGPQPGVLRLVVPGGGVEISFAQTRDGGGFIARYAGGIERLDCYAEAEGRTRVTIQPSRAELAVKGTTVFRLPSYDLATLRLAWLGAAGKKVILGGLRVRTSLLGFVVRDEALEVRGGSARGNGMAEITLSGGGADTLFFVAGAQEPAGVVELEAPQPLGVAWHLIGVAAIFAIAIAVFAAGFVLIAVLSFGRPRWLGVGFIVLVLVVGVRLWMGSWAPVLFLPDSVDYAGGGVNWVNGESLDSFRPIRVPGYAIMIGWLWQLPWTLNSMLAFVQGVMGVLTALCAWSITRKLVGRGWAAVAFMVVGLDPILLAWERFAMPETLTAFLVTFLAWIVVRNRRPGERAARGASGGGGIEASGKAVIAPVGGGRYVAWLALAVVAGVLVVVGCYIRGNFQVLVPLLPLLLVLEARRAFGWRKSLVLGTACFVVSVGLMMPQVLANKRDYGIASFMVASARNQFILAEPNGAIEINNTRAWDFATWRDLSERREARKISEWELLPRIVNSGAPVPSVVTGANASRGNPEAMHAGVEEARYAFVVQESYARRGGERLKLAGAAVSNLIGLYPWNQLHGFQENGHWTKPLRGIDATRSSNFFTDQAHAMQKGRGGEAVYRACQRDIGLALRSTDAKIFSEWFMGDRALRPVFAVLMLAGLLSALIRREWAMAWIGGVVLAHAGAMAVLAMAGIDRYGVPFEPLLRVAAVYGLAVVVGWWGHGMRRSEAQALLPL